MKAWTDKDGTTKTLVDGTETIEAQTRLDERLASIRQSLKLIGVELQKFDSLTCPDWGDVGDAAHVDRLLLQTWEFLAEVE
ncbi:MAG: hypothetical protein GY832_26170 [Chloroflexi bacterium]|nr:hypothetical protein [Chloroflexota bacterium]